MTNDIGSKRPWWIAAAVAVLGAGVVVRELVRSGTVADGFLRHWYGHVALSAVVIAAVGTGMYFLHRAYRSRE